MVVGQGWTAFHLPGVLPGNGIQPVSFLLTMASEEERFNQRHQTGCPVPDPSLHDLTLAHWPRLVRPSVGIWRGMETRGSQEQDRSDHRVVPTLRDC